MKKVFILIIFLLFASNVEAVTAVNKYVNTDCANNGDGTANTCAASPGAAGAYKTLQQAIDDIVADTPNFVTSDVAITIRCKGATADAGTGSIDAAATIDGFTLDATRNLVILSDAGDRHDGKWNTSKYRLVGSFYSGVVYILDPFVTLAWLQIEQTRTGAAPSTFGNGVQVEVSGTSGFVAFYQNILRYTGDYTNQEAEAINDLNFETSGIDKTFVNNIFYDWKKGLEFRPLGNEDIVAYNNTCYSNQAGECYTVRGSAAGSVTITAKNNLANGTNTGWDVDVTAGGTWTHNNNLSEDTTSPDNTYDSKVITFVNEATRDLHLDAADTNATDDGADLSAASPNLTIDIDNDTRVAPWDIGADEKVGGAAADNLPLLQAIGED